MLGPPKNKIRTARSRDMLNLRHQVMIGVAVFAAVTVSLYVILAQERGEPADPAYIQQCRDLARQVMDLSVEAARADLDPDDTERIDDFNARADGLQLQTDRVGCSENPEKWVYGSFQQEMIETERYIADLIRDNQG